MSNIFEALSEAIESCQDTKDKDDHINKLNNCAACDWLYCMLEEYVSEYKTITLKIMTIPPDKFIEVSIKHVGNMFEDTWMFYNNGKVLNLNCVVEVVENAESKTRGQ
jgi:hypothetical protein